MEKIIINGGKRLQGEVSISGAKNAVLGILPATVLCSGRCVLENLPDIQDIRNYITILKKLGAAVTQEENGDTVVDTSNIIYENVSDIEEESTKMRASYYLLGALLAKYKKVRLPFPGGCEIGERPIDLHIKGFRALGAEVVIENDFIEMYAEKLEGTSIYFDVVSVGATINIMLAAVLAEGVTTIENAAKEPHVVDIANFLNLAGANIKGAGTDTVKIIGVSRLHPVVYAPIPDQITAGTYMIAAAATCGNVLIKNVIPEHLEAISLKLIEMGSEVISYDDSVRVIGKRPFRPIMLKTLPYPGFPTDLQQPMGVLMSIAEGTSFLQENIFEKRFEYIAELIKMGADAVIEGNTATFNGVKTLKGTAIRSTDLRAGAAMIIAGLIADGTTEVYELKHIDRGYDRLVERLQDIGSDIERVGSEEE